VVHALAQALALGVERLDAQMLLLHSCGRNIHDRAWLITHESSLLTKHQQATFDALIQQRLTLVPVAYLTQQKEFYGLSLHIDARVLDPRADTEILVDWALECLPPVSNHPHPAWQLLDLGTGSGAIALALQKQHRDAHVWAVDASQAALEVAQINATKLELPIQLIHGHWFKHWQTPMPAPTRFDLIVSNPPYIAEQDPHMAALHHEPRQALTAGKEGLDDLQEIIQQAPSHLKNGAWLLLEHGWNQAKDVQNLLKTSGFSQVQSRVDLAGIQRVSGGQWLGVK
jgi:release factor glutamine methyltransferase